MHLIERCRRLGLRAQEGFTTVTLMGVLAVGGILVAAGFATVNPDISLSREDQDYKQAHGAAEAGLQWYLNRLGQDNNFYVRCTNVPDPNSTEQAPVNHAWNGSGSDPRLWRKLPGADAEYTVELMPAPGFTNCTEGNQYSMVDSAGNLNLRITGRSRGEYRTVRATLARLNFIDFIYFTHFETLDPAAYPNTTDTARAERECARFRSARTSFCTEIQFIPSDYVAGPFHTNDNIRVCDDPVFGRDRADRIEISGRPASVGSGGCSNDPEYQGTLVNPANQLGMPPSNTGLRDIAHPDYVFRGRTNITFNNNDTMTVENRYVNSWTPTVVALPGNGVIFVDRDVAGAACASGYRRSQRYDASLGCGDVWLRGTYSDDLTIAADNDVVIRDDLVRGSEGVLLGVIGNNFVRVYHPVNFPGSGSGCTNTSSDTEDVVIEAAILALRHSFIVDNWHCGNPLGNLNVYGAIAQNYRGPVGTGSGGSVSTGYAKEYVYNDRLRFREPPYFLDPVQAAWRIRRETEQAQAVAPSRAAP